MRLWQCVPLRRQAASELFSQRHKQCFTPSQIVIPFFCWVSRLRLLKFRTPERHLDVKLHRHTKATSLNWSTPLKRSLRHFVLLLVQGIEIKQTTWPSEQCSTQPSGTGQGLNSLRRPATLRVQAGLFSGKLQCLQTKRISFVWSQQVFCFLEASRKQT